MAIVLALVIVGWLVAFALGSQAGFDSEPVAVRNQSSGNSTISTQSANAKTANYAKRVSAS
ncbi:MAG: hypothetical protein AAFO06_06790 [Cyanobacteria bacterium J06597_16]